MVVSCCGNQFCQHCIGRVQHDHKPCPLCNNVNFTTFLHKGVMREVNSLMVCCPHRQDGCHNIWEGELGKLQGHLDSTTLDEGCGYVLVECRYKCGEMHRRNEIRKHELDNCTRRPTVSNLVEKLEGLSKKLDAVIAENENLKKENDTLKRKINQVESTCASVQSCVMPGTPFNFTVVNVAHYMKGDLEWWSTPFYSGRYKLRAVVYPNGYGNSRGVHLSINIGVMRGEYDDQLDWPFLGKVYVEVYHFSRQSWRYLPTIDFRTAPQNCSRRPTQDTVHNNAWGCALSLKELRVSYLKDDRVKFRVSCVEL